MRLKPIIIAPDDIGLIRTRIQTRSRVGSENECWSWLGALNGNGYGVIRLPVRSAGRLVLVHRVAAILWLDAPVDSEILHSCDSPTCWNPTHLRAGSHAENMAEMAERDRSSFGRKNAHAKLSDEMVSEIRRSSEGACSLGLRFGVAHQTISKARAGLTWQRAA